MFSSPPSDLDLLVRDLLVSLRGKHSQMELSRKLGFNDNRVNRWENGKRSIYWPDFVRLCEISNVKLFTFLKDFFNNPKGAEIDFPQHLLKNWSSKNISKILGVSLQTVTRWSIGESTPSLYNVFMIIHITHDLLSDFILFVTQDKENSNRIKQFCKEKSEVKDLFLNFPEVSAVISILNLHSHHSSRTESAEYISKVLNICPKRVMTILNRLKKQKWIIKDPKSGKYRGSDSFDRVNTLTKDSVLGKKDLEFWTNLGLQELAQEEYDPKNVYKYYTFTGNQELQLIIKEECRLFLQHLLSVVNDFSKFNPSSNHLDQVQVINIQSFALKSRDNT